MDIGKMLPLLLAMMSGDKNQSMAGTLGAALGGGGSPVDVLSMLPLDDKTRAVLSLAMSQKKQSAEPESTQEQPTTFSRLGWLSGSEINGILCNVFESQKQ